MPCRNIFIKRCVSHGNSLKYLQQFETTYCTARLSKLKEIQFTVSDDREVKILKLSAEIRD